MMVEMYEASSNRFCVEASAVENAPLLSLSTSCHTVS